MSTPKPPVAEWEGAWALILKYALPITAKDDIERVALMLKEVPARPPGRHVQPPHRTGGLHNLYTVRATQRATEGLFVVADTSTAGAQQQAVEMLTREGYLDTDAPVEALVQDVGICEGPPRIIDWYFN